MRYLKFTVMKIFEVFITDDFNGWRPLSTMAVLGFCLTLQLFLVRSKM